MPKVNGSGSVVQMEKDKPRSRCRKWKLVVCLGKDPYTGKYLQKNKRFEGTYSQAKIALEDFKEEVECTSSIVQNDWIFNDYVEHFEELRLTSGEVAPGTVERETTKLRALGFVIGNLKMKDVNETVVERAFLDMRKGKSRSGKPLSGTYLNDIYKKGSLMFDHALRHGIVSHNPFTGVDAPKTDTGEKSIASKRDVQALLGSLDPENHMQAALILCVTMGLRRGEVMALRWEDVDLRSKTLHVSHSIDNHLEYQTPKTKAGDRFLPIPDIAISTLTARYALELNQFAKYAPDLLDKDDDGVVVGVSPVAPVFCEQFGKPLIPNSFGRWWNRNRKKYGLENVTLHGLRHTFLTLAASEGVHPSVMQKLAGHSTSRLTMEIYTHVQMDQKREAMEAMGNVFVASEPTPDNAHSETKKTA